MFVSHCHTTRGWISGRAWELPGVLKTEVQSFCTHCTKQFLCSSQCWSFDHILFAVSKQFLLMSLKYAATQSCLNHVLSNIQKGSVQQPWKSVLQKWRKAALLSLRGITHAPTEKSPTVTVQTLFQNWCRSLIWPVRCRFILLQIYYILRHVDTFVSNARHTRTQQ
jgi:hypothetical protein